MRGKFPSTTVSNGKRKLKGKMRLRLVGFFRFFGFCTVQLSAQLSNGDFIVVSNPFSRKVGGPVPPFYWLRGSQSRPRLFLH